MKKITKVIITKQENCIFTIKMIRKSRNGHEIREVANPELVGNYIKSLCDRTNTDWELVK